MFLKSSSLDGLLLNKALTPLSEADETELDRLERLDVAGFTEADVRAEIIDHIVRILGYRKGQSSSVDREKHITFAGKKSKFIDYNIMLWEKNFWLIEAKRPNLKDNSFGYKELSQAIEYAVHPEIDAALIVLCDGYKIELFDREEDVVNPVERISISEIRQKFDNLRRLLSPMQVWFFYKRRVIRAIDRAFEHEVNQNRVVEFHEIVSKRLTEKRSQIHKNCQSLKLSENDLYSETLAAAATDDIIESYFFVGQSEFDTKVMVHNLVTTCEKESTFPLLHKIFPDRPRDANDIFYTHGLMFLIELEKSKIRCNWLPAWLKQEQNVTTVRFTIMRLIQLCLNYFSQDESRKAVLLAANTFRRIMKSLSLILPDQLRIGGLRHLLTRYTAAEFSWDQIVSSPERHTILEWDRLTMVATVDFVRRHSTRNNHFNSSVAKQELKQLWQIEKAILSNIEDYRSRLTQYNIHEIHPTEASSVVFDTLGHYCLVILRSYPEWRDYALAEHPQAIQWLSDSRSWAAREMLEIDPLATTTTVVDQELANRFFYGDTETLNELRSGYGLK